MAQNDFFIPIHYTAELVHRLEIWHGSFIFKGLSVVISDNQMFMSFKLAQIPFCRFFIAESKISDYVYIIILLYSRIPKLNQAVVHFVNVYERSVVKAYYIFVSKVRIAYV